MAEATSEAWGIGFHISRHEDETSQAQTETYEGNVQDGFFEDDIDMAVVEGTVDVSGPPEVYPVIVKLIAGFSRRSANAEFILPGDLR